MHRTAAWGVHLLTASGAVLALLAVDAVARGAFREALGWLLVALAVDGVDGTLARRLRVSEIVPRIDGAALDLVVDYLTYVLVPALILWRGNILPNAIALPLCALVMVSSLYTFVRRDMKTDDGYFRGFPALWNIVAAYLVLIPVPAAAACGIVVALIGLTFAPVYVVHPFRASDSRLLAPLAAAIWLLTTAALALGVSGALERTAVIVSLCSLGTLTLIGIAKTVRASRRQD